MSTKILSLISWHLHYVITYKDLFTLTPSVLRYAVQLTFSVADGIFKFHPYSGRPFKEYKSKMQAVKIHFFTAMQIIIHDNPL
jgi:hypothetical protein